jgi:hypothetical protein
VCVLAFRAYCGPDRMTLREARHASALANGGNRVAYDAYLDLVQARRQGRGDPLNGIDTAAVRDAAWGYARAPAGARPANEQPRNRGVLPKRAYEVEAAIHRVIEIMDDHPIGRARQVTIGVAVRITAVAPRCVVGFSGSQQRAEGWLNRATAGGGPTLRERIQAAGLALASTADQILQSIPGFQQVPGGFVNTNCAAPRCMRSARARGKVVSALAENWRANATTPNPYPIPNHPDPNAMEHCGQCQLNQAIM